MSGKRFRLAPAEIRPLAEGHGACLATDRITVGGESVGLMYRDPPDHAADSGWRFMAGTESDAYMDDAANSGVFDVNTIANYDPEIVPHLDSPVGSTFVRWPPGAPLAPEPAVAPSPPRRQALTRDWSIELEDGFDRRTVDGALQLVSAGPPERTVWLDIWEPAPDADREILLDDVRSTRRPETAEIFEETWSDGSVLFGSWYHERIDGRDQWALYGYTFTTRTCVQSAFVASVPDLEWALRTWRSLRCGRAT